LLKRFALRKKTKGGCVPSYDETHTAQLAVAGTLFQFAHAPVLLYVRLPAGCVEANQAPFSITRTPHSVIMTSSIVVDGLGCIIHQ
jgi:hypothetical protein